MIPPSVRTRILPAVERANVWLAERSLRERRLLAGLAVVGLAAALWYGALQPLLAARQSAQARIDLYAELQGRLVAAPSGTAPPTAVALSGPLEAAVKRAAAEQGLTAQTVGDRDRVQISLVNARFDNAMAFIAGLEAAGAVLGNVRLQATAQPGLVNLELTAARP